jgi:hypothetical protein
VSIAGLPGAAAGMIGPAADPYYVSSPGELTLSSTAGGDVYLDVAASPFLYGVNAVYSAARATGGGGAGVGSRMLNELRAAAAAAASNAAASRGGVEAPPAPLPQVAAGKGSDGAASAPTTAMPSNA